MKYSDSATELAEVEAIYHEEGRVTPNGANWQYEYTISDHLGNARVSFADLDHDGVINENTEILQTQSYYPFGLEHSGIQSPQVAPENFYKFQGQETQTETGWSSFKWRNADPTIGRFFNIDPISEDYYYNSPYAFSENKVTAHIELEGLESYYTADGILVGNVGDYGSERVLNNEVSFYEASSLINEANSDSDDAWVASDQLFFADSRKAYLSEDEAAVSFGKENNQESLSKDVERASVINSVNLQDGKNVFILGDVTEGKTYTDRLGVTHRETDIDIDNDSKGLPGELSSIVHTHGKGSNTFSGRDYTIYGAPKGDKRVAEHYGVPIYLINKKKEVWQFDPAKAEQYGDEYGTNFIQSLPE